MSVVNEADGFDSATTIFPMILYNVILHALIPDSLQERIDEYRDPGRSDSSREDRLRDFEAWDRYIYQARGIILGIEIGLLVVFWGPLILWKRLVSVDLFCVFGL